jgi:Zn-dependent metalloprotease
VKVQTTAAVASEKASKEGDKKKGRLSPKKKLAIKITAIVLSFCILLSSISVALVYFNVIDIPFIRKMLNNMGIHDYIAEFNSLTGEFTDIKITDDESAIEAARDGAKQLGLEDAVQELSIIYSDDVNGMTYYRIQQHYDGIPVYGKTITVSADEDGTATGFASNIELWTDTSEKSSITTEQAQSAFGSYAVANSLSETGDVTVLPFDETDVYYQTDGGEL